MRATFATLVLLTVLTGGPASSGERAGDPGTNVEMPILIAPMTTGGKLTSYAYISCKVVTTSRNAALEVRDKIPFIQDAFVRDVNAAPIAKDDEVKIIDRSALSARLTGVVRRVIGAAKIAGVTIIQIQAAWVHPTETPSPSASATPPV